MNIIIYIIYIYLCIYVYVNNFGHNIPFLSSIRFEDFFFVREKSPIQEKRVVLV